jgi:hypothetical protein
MNTFLCPRCGELLESTGTVKLEGKSFPIYQWDTRPVQVQMIGQSYRAALTCSTNGEPQRLPSTQEFCTRTYSVLNLASVVAALASGTCAAPRAHVGFPLGMASNHGVFGEPGAYGAPVYNRNRREGRHRCRPRHRRSPPLGMVVSMELDR